MLSIPLLRLGFHSGGWGGRSFAEVTTAQKPVAAEGVPSDNNSLEKRNANTFIANSWLTGPSWPLNGEIDIVEGVNLQSTNKITLHSDPGCIIKGKDCQGSQGCSIDAGPYGSGINSAGGATYALEWTSSGMSIWG